MKITFSGCLFSRTNLRKWLFRSVISSSSVKLVLELLFNDDNNNDGGGLLALAFALCIKPVKLNRISQMYYSVIKQNTIMKINSVCVCVVIFALVENIA